MRCAWRPKTMDPMDHPGRCPYDALTAACFCGRHEPHGTPARFRQALEQLRAIAETHLEHDPRFPIWQDGDAAAETILRTYRTLIGEPTR